MSWAAVHRWLDRLREAPRPATELSDAGLKLVIDDALDALTPDHLAAAALPGEPWPDATFIAARTVHTAPIEWLAVLLGRGTRVTLKHPRGAPGLAPWLLQHAGELPLQITDDAPLDTGLVIAMGHSATINTIRAQLQPHQRLLGFGSRFSAAWLPDITHVHDLARDLAAHDSRGCMSPAVVLGPASLAPALAEAMAEAQRRWPRGALSRVEQVALRTQAALARVAGELHEGEGWQVAVLPPEQAAPHTPPRTVQLVDADLSWLTPHAHLLSALGVPHGVTVPPPGPAARVVPLGHLQRPPLVRLHDGVDWLRATLRGP